MDSCNGVQCKNGGICVEDEELNTQRCWCPTGWEGQDCSLDVDECLHQPPLCQNEGICINKIGHYECKCHDGYEGQFCQLDIDECKLSNPCKNGGVCSHVLGREKFECKCPEGKFFFSQVEGLGGKSRFSKQKHQTLSK